MRFQRSAPRKVSIDIAPLVDVVFLLVIFFAASTTFLETSGLQLELPESTATAERPARPLTVAVDASGRLAFEGRTQDEAELLASLRKALAERKDKTVVLKADSRTPHGTVVHVMDLVRQAGAEGLTVATQAARKTPGPPEP